MHTGWNALYSSTYVLVSYKAAFFFVGYFCHKEKSETEGAKLPMIVA